MCFCQAEDGIRDLVRSRGLGDVYKRQVKGAIAIVNENASVATRGGEVINQVVVTMEGIKSLSLIHI